MAYKRHYDEEVISSPINWPTYTRDDLDAFAEFLKKYKNINDARVAVGAMSRKMHYGTVIYCVLVTKTGEWQGRDVYKNPTEYELFEHKLKALEQRDGKREYAQKMEMEGLSHAEPPPLKSEDYGIPF